ncbi:MAG: hypothetical protein HGA45_00300 [Chloroflexales bacterium]|nr:hypothetical protein [Chloroflexales bacterium]
MNSLSDVLLTDLRCQIADLGRAGGLISASIYDTAQVLRLAPPDEEVWPAIEWLLAQQRADGGWGSPAVPLARAVPTLAAVLTLYRYGQRRSVREAADEGLACLRREANHWVGNLPDDLPVGVELLFPRLLDDAREAGIALPTELYRPLLDLGARRRQLIARMPLAPGTTAVHSWEAYGTRPDPNLLDASGSVGHSPAATAAWLWLASGRAELAVYAEGARAYLEQAAHATQVGIPGVVPTAWPIDRFELAYAMHTILAGGYFDQPELRAVIATKVDELARALRPEGLGCSDAFVPDGDDTAAAVAVLGASGRPAPAAALTRFACGASFYSYLGELQPSLITSARAVQALTIYGHDMSASQSYLIERQSCDGRWQRDKWNSSWLYTTYQAMLALGPSFSHESLARALDILLDYQQPDGSWCTIDSSELEETAYGVLICRLAMRHGLGGERVAATLSVAMRWLYDHYRPFSPRANRCWLAKENYSPIRISRVIELVALLPEHV